MTPAFESNPEVTIIKIQNGFVVNVRDATNPDGVVIISKNEKHYSPDLSGIKAILDTVYALSKKDL